MKYQIGEKEYPVIIIRKNNKNTYIRIKNNTIEISTHYLTTKRQISNLLENNQDSIKKMLKQCQQREEKKQNFFYLGKRYDIIKIPTDKVEIINDKIYTTDSQQLKKWYLEQLKIIYTEQYQLCYQKFEEKIPFYRFRVRQMKTRWGVCNRKSQTITLNTELLHYNIEVIDYVIIHELSHLIHFNHSKEFWKTVEKYCPNYKEIKKQLKE